MRGGGGGGGGGPPERAFESPDVKEEELVLAALMAAPGLPMLVLVHVLALLNKLN